MKNSILCFILTIFLSSDLLAQSRISEVSRDMVTYPYSNPNPIPEFGTIYPYFRFDGYTAKGENNPWKMIEMENDFIKLWITPEIGGKIWGAVDKATGKEFLYFNHVVKFRDIAMRGAWTSGGLEINFGVIGHAPTCSSPVDYFVRINPDSSVSCYIGALDLPSRTEWRVEVELPKDQAGFTTSSIWYNGSPFEQSYYHWMNAGVKSKGNLEYAYPGAYYLGHDGRNFPYPVDPQGRKISFYENNNFGPAKSYHVAGTYTDFFGGYWHDDDFGFGHYAEYADKPGKKIWIWGLARSGMIWEGLLTDDDGQYSEIQSGRLFNQAGASSTLTPFKHRSFLPYTSDCWNEFWFPVKGIKGLIYGTKSLSFNLVKEGGSQLLNLYASKNIDARLRVMAGEKEIFNEPLKMPAAGTKQVTLPQNIEEGDLSIMLGDEILYASEINHTNLSRPVESPPDFDLNKGYGLFVAGKEWERQRYFEKAKECYNQCLTQDPWFIPAISSLAGILIREMRYEDALVLTKRALSIDTYDPAANYNYGLANSALGNQADALDGFSIASQSIEYRPAALTQLAINDVKEGLLEKAAANIRRSLLFNQHNLITLQMSVTVARLMGNPVQAKANINLILQFDPLNHFAHFEKFLLSSDPADAAEFKKYIRNELPHETYLELAILYHNLGRNEEAMKVLEFAPEHPMVQVWKSYLVSKSGLSDQSLQMLAQASSLSPAMVFPFRQEDAAVLRWAVSVNDNWKFKYYLALNLANLSHQGEALDLLKSCGDSPDFYPFYNTRAGLDPDEAGKERDLAKACQLTDDWRPVLALAKYYGNKNQWDKANSIVEPYFKKHSDNYYAGLYLGRCYLNLGKYTDGISLMTALKVLPNEGASEGRETWRSLQLNGAVQAMGKNNFKSAIRALESAKLWPENLGVGRPYDVDGRLEDYLLALCYDKSHQADKAQAYLAKTVTPIRKVNYIPSATGDLISALALRKSGNQPDAERLMRQWLDQSQQDKKSRWGTAMFYGKADEALRILNEPEKIAERFPDERLHDDPEFNFVVKYKDILFGD